jgi:AcrR family transcriptional regulator
VNSVSTQTRKYELKARAESQRETRDRIAAAAAELHEENGVARTTVSEIARRAGVQRLTVYNHFPGLEHLLPACSAHYAALHPEPDLSATLAGEDPAERLRLTLEAMYRWYRENRRMFTSVESDRGSVPELDRFCRENSDRRQAQLADALASGFGARGLRAERVRALVGLAIDFWTWRRLDREGLDDAAAAALMTESVAAL